MAILLNQEAWEELLDGNMQWLRQMPRTQERDHITHCLEWLRTNKPMLSGRYKKYPKAWLHILDTTEGIPENKCAQKLTFSEKNPFGKPGRDYSEEFPYTCIPLYTE